MRAFHVTVTALAQVMCTHARTLLAAVLCTSKLTYSILQLTVWHGVSLPCIAADCGEPAANAFCVAQDANYMVNFTLMDVQVSVRCLHMQRLQWPHNGL